MGLAGSGLRDGLVSYEEGRVIELGNAKNIVAESVILVVISDDLHEFQIVEVVVGAQLGLIQLSEVGLSHGQPPSVLTRPWESPHNGLYSVLNL